MIWSHPYFPIPHRTAVINVNYLEREAQFVYDTRSEGCAVLYTASSPGPKKRACRSLAIACSLASAQQQNITCSLKVYVEQCCCI